MLLYLLVRKFIGRCVPLDCQVTHVLPSCPPLQEDAHAAVLDVDGNSRTGFFAVFDGHGGKEVAKFCANHLVGGASVRSPACDSFLSTQRAQVHPSPVEP